MWVCWIWISVAAWLVPRLIQFQCFIPQFHIDPPHDLQVSLLFVGYKWSLYFYSTWASTYSALRAMFARCLFSTDQFLILILIAKLQQALEQFNMNLTLNLHFIILCLRPIRPPALSACFAHIYCSVYTTTSSSLTPCPYLGSMDFKNRAFSN